jgi:hypothetical protein
MAIDSADLKKIDVDLTAETTLPLDYYFVIAKDGAVPKKILCDTLLRSQKRLQENYAGDSSATIDFSDYTLANIVIDEDFTLTISEMPDGSTAWLYVAKGSSDNLTISGYDYLNAGVQQGRTKLLYRIDHLYSYVVVTQVDVDEVSYLSQSDIDVVTYGNSFTSFSNFNWALNGNLLTVQSRFTINLAGSSSSFKMDLSNYDFIPYNTSTNVSVTALKSAALVPASGIITTDSITVYFSTAQTGDVEITLTASYRVK